MLDPRKVELPPAPATPVAAIDGAHDGAADLTSRLRTDSHEVQVHPRERSDSRYGSNMTVDNPVPESSATRDWMVEIGLTALSAVPVVGPLASRVIAEQLRQAARERDLDWARMTNARLAMLEQQGVKIDAQDPAFLAAVARLHRAAAETADERKRALLAHVAAGAGSWSTFSFERREEFVEMVAELRPVHVQLLVKASERTPVDTAGNLYEADPRPLTLTELGEATGVPNGDIVWVMQPLVSKKLLSTHWVAPGDLVTSTELGEEFLKFLRQDDITPGHAREEADEA